MLSEDRQERKKQISEALHAANGDRSKAAEILGIPPTELKDKIHASPELKAMWANPRAPQDEVEAMAKAAESVVPELVVDAVAAPVLRSDLEIARIVDHNERALAEGLERMGLSAQEVNYAVEFKRFNDRNLGATLSITTGTLTKRFLQLNTLAENLQARLMKDYGTTEDAIAKRRTDQELFDRANAHLINIHKECQVGTFMLAKIDHMKKAGTAPGGGKKSKPGFAPLTAVNAAPGSTVILQGGNKK